MSDILVVGSMNMDETVRVRDLPRPGETVLGGAVEFTPGGKGGNQAAAAASLIGARGRVRMAGLVGNDDHGVALRADLARRGVVVDEIGVVAGDGSGVAMIAVDDTGENTIIISPGVNSRWTMDRVDAVEVNPGDVVLCQLEIPLPAVARMVTRAVTVGARVVLNAAPPQALPKSVLDAVDVLVVNEHEAEVVLGRAPATPSDLDSIAAEVDCAVVVTLGARGALVRPLGACATAVPAFVVQAVSTVGAGDAFVGALAVELLAGRALLEAVRYACAVGALATTAAGARGYVPSPIEVDALLGSTSC